MKFLFLLRNKLALWKRELRIKHMGLWNYCVWEQDNYVNKFIKPKYNSQDQSRAENPEYIVYFICNGFEKSGGMADRLKGLISVYGWCKKHQIQFGIYWDDPFELTDYLRIKNNKVLANSLLRPCFNLKDISVKRMMMGGLFGREEIRLNLNNLSNKWFDENLRNRGYKQSHIYTNLKTEDSNFGLLFNELFQPVPFLQDAINEQLNCIGGKYISISFRFTTLLGDFQDITKDVLPLDERKKLIESCVNEISVIRKDALPHEKVLVTADSCTFLETVKQMPDVYVIPGTVGHIDHEKNEDVNLKMFLDFFLISKAEACYQAITGKMYGGEFSKSAAMINNVPFKTHVF